MTCVARRKAYQQRKAYRDERSHDRESDELIQLTFQNQRQYAEECTESIVGQHNLPMREIPQIEQAKVYMPSISVHRVASSNDTVEHLPRKIH